MRRVALGKVFLDVVVEIFHVHLYAAAAAAAAAAVRKVDPAQGTLKFRFDDAVVDIESRRLGAVKSGRPRGCRG